MKLATVLGVVGRVLLTVGVLTLLFVGYQLWGTGIHEARAQNSLSSEFDDVLAAAGTTEADGSEGTAGNDHPGTAEDTSEAPPAPDLVEGDAIAHIEIPALGVDKVVVEGVGVEDLKRGPGRFPGTALPGQEGNAAIAGHRTTYGAPFHRIDELRDGDNIIVTTVQGRFTYEYREQLIVGPSETHVLEDHDDHRLTLVACHPKYSAAQRIVVVAELADHHDPLPATDSALHRAEELAPAEADSEDGADGQGDESEPEQDDEADDPEQGAAGQPGTDSTDSTDSTDLAYVDLDGHAGLALDDEAIWPAVLLGLACAAIWLAAWAAARFIGPLKPVIAYALGTPLFLVALFFFFEDFSRFLPANF